MSALTLLFLIPFTAPSLPQTISTLTQQSENIVINEILPRPGEDWDEDGEFDANGDEFIELYNPTTTDIDLSGWVLDDIEGGSRPYRIPDGTIILAKGHLLYFGSMTGIGLNNDGDTVRLIDQQGTVVDTRSYSFTQTDVSYARTPDGVEAWSESAQPTPSVTVQTQEPHSKYVLRGRVVTMESESSIIDDGYVLIEASLVRAIWSATDSPPVGVSLQDLEVIETNGIILPGLIDLHNHLAYDSLPVWRVPQLYANRDQWLQSLSYKAEVSWPKTLLTSKSYADLEAEVIKYAEVKALVGGTTAIQGSPGQRSTYGSILVRNVELRNFGIDKVYQNLMPVHTLDQSYYLDRIVEGRADAIFLHVAEGNDVSSRAEFATLKEKGLVVEQLVVIHGTALSKEDFVAMSTAGAKLVWSPLSNLLLYGNTTDVVAAWEAGVRLSLAPDWSPTGSKNVLVELKIASQWNKVRLGGFFSDYQLVQMVTTNPAYTLGWDDYVGQIKAGMRADFLVIKDKGGDPYRVLIGATDGDVLLVAIDGEPLYGRWDWLERIKPGDWEPVGCPGIVRGLDVTFPDSPRGTQTLIEIESKITEAMRFEPWLNNPDYPNLHPIDITPLFTLCDEQFFDAISSSRNTTLPFDLRDGYYLMAELDTDGDNIDDTDDLDDDNDGLEDAWERELGTDVLSPDSDRDHIIDSQDPYPLDSARAKNEGDFSPYAIAGIALAVISVGGYYYMRHRRSAEGRQSAPNVSHQFT